MQVQRCWHLYASTMMLASLVYFYKPYALVKMLCVWLFNYIRTMFKCLHSLLGYDGNSICVEFFAKVRHWIWWIIGLLASNMCDCNITCGSKAWIILLFQKSKHFFTLMYIFFYFLLTATSLFAAAIYFSGILIRSLYNFPG